MNLSKSGWRSRLSYPHHVFRNATLYLLDSLNDLLPLPDTGDRYVDISDWLREGQTLGLLTRNEEQDLRYVLAHLL